MSRKSYWRTCKYCGASIQLRPMPGGQWLAFESYDRIHTCKPHRESKAPVPKASVAHENSRKRQGATKSSGGLKTILRQLDFAEISVSPQAARRVLAYHRASPSLSKAANLSTSRGPASDGNGARPSAAGGHARPEAPHRRGDNGLPIPDVQPPAPSVAQRTPHPARRADRKGADRRLAPHTSAISATPAVTASAKPTSQVWRDEERALPAAPANRKTADTVGDGRPAGLTILAVAIAAVLLLLWMLAVSSSPDPTPVPTKPAAPTPATTLPPTPSPLPTLPVQGAPSLHAWVYDMPNTGGEVVRGIEPGEQVIVLGRQAGGVWCHVQLDNGQEGWIYCVSLNLGPEIERIPFAP